jgi:murein DD-endopeptidase MepM/ murein hydrolase activator NlpD
MENAKNFFLKTPIKFSRLTSRFSNNRYHPVQHRWKAHGTDYAAPRHANYDHSIRNIIEQDILQETM